MWGTIFTLWELFSGNCVEDSMRGIALEASSQLPERMPACGVQLLAIRKQRSTREQGRDWGGTMPCRPGGWRLRAEEVQVLGICRRKRHLHV